MILLHLSLVKGDISPTLPLKPSSVLYVSSFPNNILSIRSITKTLNCKVTLFSSSCIFQKLHATSSLKLSSVLDVLSFPNNLYSISSIAKTLNCNCKVTFFPPHAKETIGYGRMHSGLYQSVKSQAMSTNTAKTFHLLQYRDAEQHQYLMTILTWTEESFCSSFFLSPLSQSCFAHECWVAHTMVMTTTLSSKRPTSRVMPLRLSLLLQLSPRSKMLLITIDSSCCCKR